MATFFRMRAKDRNPESNKAIFREWVVQDIPDIKGEKYSGQKNGPLQDIVVEYSWKTPEIINTGGGSVGGVGPAGPAGEGLDIFRPSLLSSGKVDINNLYFSGLYNSEDNVIDFATFNSTSSSYRKFENNVVCILKSFNPNTTMLDINVGGGEGGKTPPNILSIKAELNCFVSTYTKIGSEADYHFGLRYFSSPIALKFIPESIVCENYVASIEGSIDPASYLSSFWVYGNNMFYNPKANIYIKSLDDVVFSKNIGFFFKNQYINAYLTLSSNNKAIYACNRRKTQNGSNADGSFRFMLSEKVLQFVDETPTNIKTFELSNGSWIAFVMLTNDDGRKYTKLYFIDFSNMNNTGAIQPSLIYCTTYNYDFVDLCVEPINFLDYLNFSKNGSFLNMSDVGDFLGIVNENGKIKIIKFSLNLEISVSNTPEEVVIKQ